MEHFVQTNVFARIRTVFARIWTIFACLIIGCAIRYPKMTTYTIQCLRYNIYSAWFLDIRISICCFSSRAVCNCKISFYILILRHVDLDSVASLLIATLNISLLHTPVLFETFLRVLPHKTLNSEDFLTLGGPNITNLQRISSSISMFLLACSKYFLKFSTKNSTCVKLKEAHI